MAIHFLILCSRFWPQFFQMFIAIMVIVFLKLVGSKYLLTTLHMGVSNEI